jgi:magnesium chelatase accessory protein
MSARRSARTVDPDWPNRAASRFVAAAGLTWHVQVMGAGPVLLLAHGTGAATHSWRALAPALAAHFTVVAPDLPGHGFTDAPGAALLSLPGMARGLDALLRALALPPVALAVGHSAGAAVLARLCLDGRIAPAGLVGLNPALLAPEGPAGSFFSPLARLLVRLPLVPQVFAWRAADPSVVSRLIRDTGSVLDPAGLRLYRRLVTSPRHAAAALGMMANWDVRPVTRELPRLAPALLLIVGGNDRAVPPEAAERVRRMVPGSRVVAMEGLGHLAHEEQPAATASRIVAFARDLAVLPP